MATLFAIAIAAHFSAAVDPAPPALCPPDYAWFCEGDEMLLTDELRRQYEQLFATCLVTPGRREEIENTITRVMRARGRYERVAGLTHVPWYVIAAIHDRECSGDFRCHLHNGDPLSRRTTDVPKGRPLKGSPPFTWEQSAVDALELEGFAVWGDWSVAGTIYKIEAFNGWGSRNHGINTGYLWSGSQHYVAGKYVRDHVYDPAFVDRQTGAAVLLRRMEDEHLIDFTPIAAAPAASPTCKGMDY